MNLKLASFLISALFLSACTAPIKTQVTRFHMLSAPVAETFVIISKTEVLSESLEFKTYASTVSSYLRNEGFIPAGSSQPDLIVKIDYGISPPIEQRRRSVSSYPFYGGFYFAHGYPYFPYGYYRPYYYRHSRFAYGFGYSSYDYSYLVYERVFEMSIQRKNGQILFEGRAVSIGRNKILPEIMPFLIQSMFADFPGQSGMTVEISIKPEKK